MALDTHSALGYNSYNELVPIQCTYHVNYKE